MTIREGAWGFYDELIEGVPEDICVKRACLGVHWSYVEAECGMGVGFTTRGGAVDRARRDGYAGASLREIARLSCSWNFLEASIGVAALNAWYARLELIGAMGALYDPKEKDESDEKPRKEDVFEVLMPDMAGRKVTVIGHFPRIERIANIAELTVLERSCSESVDTPDPACEYVIPTQDYVFMTGVTIINKTAPRLLELAKNAQTVFVGPSSVPAACLFDRGVEVIAGSTVVDPEKMRTFVEQGTGRSMFNEALRMFRIDRRTGSHA